MKKKKLLLLIGLLLITSCSRNNSFSSANNSSYVSSIIENSSSEFNASINQSGKENPLEKYKEGLKKISEDKDIIKNYYSLNVSNKNSLIDEANRKSYKEYSELISSTQEYLKNAEYRKLFVEEYGELEVRFIESIDVNKIFFNRMIPEYDYENIIASGNNIVKSIENKEDVKTVISKFNSFFQNYQNVIDAYYICNIYKDLYLDNNEYLEKYNVITTSYNEMENLYKVILKNLLNSNEYEQTTIETFNLTEEEVTKFKEQETYSQDIINLFNEETLLMNKYNLSNVDLTKLYLDLVNKRKEIASKLGYDNYLDYVYKETYNRDYTVSEGSSLIDSIISNKYLVAKYRTLNASSTSSRIIGENDLLKGLENVETIVPESKDVLKKMKTYGYYNFDSRTNKASGAYETGLDCRGENSFIFASTSGRIDDYSTVFHEYGHYLADELNENEPNLDLAEIQSQGLEFLMSNYYSKILNENETRYMIKKNTVDALWTMYSSSMVTKFENYVYSTPNLTLDKINQTFATLQVDYIYPYTLGKNGYTLIPHIYSSPGYYISYLTSLIPALEIWAEPNLNNGIAKYNKIVKSNEYTFKEALEKANIISPFESEAIDLIAKRIDLV